MWRILTPEQDYSLISCSKPLILVLYYSNKDTLLKIVLFRARVAIRLKPALLGFDKD